MSKAKYAVAVLSLSAAGLLATATREGGFVRTGYYDPVGIPTVCAGHTATAKVGRTETLSTCERLLQEDTAQAEEDVKRLVKVKLTQRQYDELVDFVFNVGGWAFSGSTLLKYINSGQCMAAGAEFARWVHAKGKVLRGLVARRAENRAGWESGC